MLDSIKSGSKIRCTVTKTVRPGDAQDTVMRLMRQDPAVRRRLKKASEYRMRTLHVRSRGGRPWEAHERSPKYVTTNEGDAWTMILVPHIVPDLKSVEKYLKIENA